MRTRAVWAGFAGRLDKDRLGQIELARDDLHLRWRQIIGAKDDCQGVPGKAGFGEDITGVKVQHHWVENLSKR